MAQPSLRRCFGAPAWRPARVNIALISRVDAPANGATAPPVEVEQATLSDHAIVVTPVSCGRHDSIWRLSAEAFVDQRIRQAWRGLR